MKAALRRKENKHKFGKIRCGQLKNNAFLTSRPFKILVHKEIDA